MTAIKGKLRVGRKSGYAILDESGLTVAVIQGKNREAVAAELVRRWNAQEPKCRDTSMDNPRIYIVPDGFGTTKKT